MTTSKLTGPATAVHIHVGNPGRFGRVVAALCGGEIGNALSCKPLSGFLWHAVPLFGPVLTGPTYADVHTKRNPHGELRGQITVVPLSGKS